MILYEALHNDIDWNLDKEYVLDSFGIFDRNDELVLPPNIHDLWTYWNIHFRYFFIKL